MDWSRGISINTSFWKKAAILVPLFAAAVATSSTVGDFLRFHLSRPSAPLEKYKRPGSKPTYALITGGNGGIGYGIALSLVKNGFGVILLGRNGDKLDEAATQLRQALVLPAGVASSEDRDAFVKTIVLDPKTASGEDIQEAIRKEIIDPGLNVSILVNNVGGVPIAKPTYRTLITYTTADIDNTIDLNARFMTHLTAQMLPILAQGHPQDNPSSKSDRAGRSLILNISSGANIGMPFTVIYGATKAFVSIFNVGLSRELKADPKMGHIDVLAVIVTGDVRSPGNSVGVAKDAPDSETYGAWIVEKTDGAVSRGWKEMNPCWLHDWRSKVWAMRSERTIDKMLIGGMTKMTAYRNQAASSKNE